MKSFDEFNEAKNFKIIDTHINDIVVGDVIDHKGKHMTVGRNDIVVSSLMGTSIFGDTYTLGRKPVKKVVFNKAK